MNWKFKSVHAAIELGVPVLDTVDNYEKKYVTWRRKKYGIDLTLTKYKRHETSNVEYRRLFLEHLGKF